MKRVTEKTDTVSQNSHNEASTEVIDWSIGFLPLFRGDWLVGWFLALVYRYGASLPLFIDAEPPPRWLIGRLVSCPCLSRWLIGRLVSCLCTEVIDWPVGFLPLFIDTEPPKVVSCEGPKTKDSFIYSTDHEQYVNWSIPEFVDNSGEKVRNTSLFPLPSSYLDHVPHNGVKQ